MSQETDGLRYWSWRVASEACAKSISRWRDGERPVLWISGPPGSGKSELAQHVASPRQCVGRAVYASSHGLGGRFMLARFADVSVAVIEDEGFDVSDALALKIITSGEEVAVEEMYRVARAVVMRVPVVVVSERAWDEVLPEPVRDAMIGRVLAVRTVSRSPVPGAMA